MCRAPPGLTTDLPQMSHITTTKRVSIVYRYVGRRRLYRGSFPMHEALTDSSANPGYCMP